MSFGGKRPATGGLVASKPKPTATDEWLEGDIFESKKNTSAIAGRDSFGQENRSSAGSKYTGFGIKSQKKEEEDLDFLIDDLEERKGIKEKKPVVEKTTTSLAYNESKRAGGNPWGKNELDELEDP